MWRKLRKIFFWTIGTIVGLILVLAFVLWLMQDKIKGYAVAYLNEHLKTELKVDEIDVTFLTTFPNASLKFKNVRILDPDSLQEYRDTLFNARTVFIKFGLWDIFSGDYKARKIDIYDGYLRAFINKDGRENYDIIRPQPKDSVKDKKAFELELKSVNLYNTRLTYHNAAIDQQYKFYTNTFSFKGNFGDEIVKLNAAGDLKVREMRNKKLVMLKNQESMIDFHLEVNNKTKTLTFTDCEWSPGKMKLGIKGNVKIIEDGTDCDVTVFGKNISLVSVMQLLPDKMRKNVDRYKSFGNLNLTADIKGVSSKTKGPDVKASFDIKDGILIEKTTNISLHNIDLKANFTNKNKIGVDELNVERMSARLKDGEIFLSGKLTDFNKPHFVIKVKGKSGLATLHDFMNPESVKEMKGEIALDSQLDFVLMRTDDLLLTNTIINEAKGNVVFTDATVLINENGKPITGLNGQLNLHNDDALVDGLTGKVGESDFSINGAIKNFTPFFLTGNQDLSVVGAFHSTTINFLDFLSQSSTEEKNATTSTGYNFPDNINFNFDMNIDHAKWETFDATNLKGNFKLLDKVLNATGLNIDLAGGKCTGYVNIDGTGEKAFLVEASTKIENVQLPKLLELFKNFGQDFITPKNTKGVLTANVNWGMPVGHDLKIEQHQLLAQADISITKGELKEVEQLQSLGDFMRTDKKLKLFLKNDADHFSAKVKHLKFDDLKNELTIKDGKLTIPKMVINSNLMKLNFSGSQDFNNKIDYHFNFRFVELKTDKSNTEFGEVADDGTGIKVYIHMFGDLKNPTYEWDKEEKKLERKEQWEAEKQNFKSILKEEFGLFKKDTSVHVEQRKKEDVKFIMEWDEQDKEKQMLEEQKKKDNERLKKLKKKLGIDENANKDVKFDIEE